MPKLRPVSAVNCENYFFNAVKNGAYLKITTKCKNPKRGRDNLFGLIKLVYTLFDEAIKLKLTNMSTVTLTNRTMQIST